jgi:hypothetical protein
MEMILEDDLERCVSKYLEVVMACPLTYWKELALREQWLCESEMTYFFIP